jgi:hypothetical protein
MNGIRSGSGSWIRSRGGSRSGSMVHNRLRGGVCNWSDGASNRLRSGPGSGNSRSVSRDGRSGSGG